MSLDEGRDLGVPRVVAKGAPVSPQGSQGVPLGGGALGPPGALGLEALRASGLGKRGLAITRSVLERRGLSKGGGLAVPGETVRGELGKWRSCRNCCLASLDVGRPSI